MWSSSIHDKISGHPSNGKHDNDLEQVEERGVEQDLIHQVFLVGRSEDFVIFAGAGVVVMLAVRNAPRVVGHEQG